MTQNVAVFTTAALSFDTTGTFPDIRVQRLISPRTTEFENIYTAQGRIQVTRPSPTLLEPQDCFYLREAEVVHCGPVCDEVSSAFVDAIRRDAFLGLTPQGWLRRWDTQGHVTQDAANWTDAGKWLARANCVVTSIEDLNGDWQVAHKWAAQTRLLVVTQSSEGCTAFINGEAVHVPAPQVEEVAPTGAGDIFAAALFLSLRRGNEILRACEFACCIAAQSVTRPKLEGLPTAEDIRHCSEG
ncbi:MAG: hypothetical protein HC853_03310 [Anaerolineae bacterium]|nr:hypothetical protein [Anaerolineae bacterium]